MPAVTPTAAAADLSGVRVTGSAEGAPDGCTVDTVAGRLLALAEAVNDADPAVVSDFFGTSDATFEWYCMQSFTTYSLDELDAYFQRRYAQQERWRLQSVQVNGWDQGRGLLHFGPVIISRTADDLDSASEALGKGAYSCRRREFVVLCLGEGTDPGAGDVDAAFACPVTAPTANPPDDTDVFGDGPGAEWLCSDDNELCAVKNGPWPAGGWKVGWRKPLRSTLTISGRRLDREAPPLGTGVPDGYFGTFQASGLIFPTEGCWEVEAEAADSRLRFVVEVEPRERVPQGGSCQTLAEAVEASDGILVGRVVESKPGPEERYVWQEIGVQGIWKNPYGRGSFTGIILLQDTDLEPLLVEGGSYLLFLQRDPFQLFCPERTLAEIVNGELVGVVDDSTGARLWKEEEVAALRERIKALVTSPQGE